MQGSTRGGYGGGPRGPGLLVGYLPLLLVGVAIAAMVVLVPSEVPEEVAVGGGSSAPAPGADEEDVGTAASGWDDTVQPCEDRDTQVDSGYSPPCFTFSGSNGGATHRGVTEDAIRVSFRNLSDGHLLETLAILAGQSLGESPEDVWRTADGLIDYFNENYEFYGRQIELERFDGGGSLTTELLGAGQDNATVDARRAVDMEAFADASGYTSTQPYAEALTDQGVVVMGAPYMSREWFTERAPYAWSIFPDCTYVSEVSAQIGNERVLGEPAVMAGGEMEGQERRLGIIYPNNEEYVRCGEHAQEILAEGGNEPELVQNYTLDLAQTDANANAILAKLRDENITSVACGCDPLMVRALAIKAEQQSYYPEWFMLGVGFVDLDLVGQIVSAESGDQWTRSFGGSPSAAPEPFGESEAYRAFKSVRPDEEPSLTVDLIYSNMLRLAIGVQMAGPELTPENFAVGMYNYPGGTGAMGSWDFSPENMPGVVDARFVFWQPDAPSPFNGEPGTYADTGERFTDPADAPTQDELMSALEGLQ